MPEFQKAPQLQPYHFQKGVSGNPGGLPKAVRTVRKAAAGFAPEALERVLALMRQNDDLPLALQAAKEILLRGIGKPAEIEQLYPKGGAPTADLDTDGLSTNQLERMIAIAREGLP